ncbi:MAG: hypothetical protein DRO00_08315 [Thermoproteota archaeon]|nr:MAG: hypothetical protein DRO00_08315 [Candidatus Korarchaeota archaeon]
MLKGKKKLKLKVVGVEVRKGEFKRANRTLNVEVKRWARGSKLLVPEKEYPFKGVKRRKKSTKSKSKGSKSRSKGRRRK